MVIKLGCCGVRWLVIATPIGWLRLKFWTMILSLELKIPSISSFARKTGYLNEDLHQRTARNLYCVPFQFGLVIF